MVAWTFNDITPGKVPLEHEFELEDYSQTCERVRRTSAHNTEVIKEESTKMLNDGVVRPSLSPCGFAVVITTKKYGKLRFCVECRPLNKRMKADKWPLHNHEELSERAAGGRIFSSLDIFTGYWNTWKAEELQEITTFRCQLGSYCVTLLPFGIKSSTATFRRVADLLLGDFPFVLVYIDDIVIGYMAREEHLQHLEDVFGRLKMWVSM